MSMLIQRSIGWPICERIRWRWKRGREDSNPCFSRSFNDWEIKVEKFFIQIEWDGDAWNEGDEGFGLKPELVILGQVSLQHLGAG